MTISTTYGSGIVYSELIIGNQTEINPQQLETTGFIDDYIPDFIKDLFNDTVNELDTSNKYSQATNSLTFELFGKILDFKDAGTNWVIKFSNKDTRNQAVSDFIWFIISLSYPIIYVFLPLIVVVELFIIVQCLGRGGGQTITRFVSLHTQYFMRAVEVFKSVFTIAFDMLKLTIDTVLGLLGAVLPW